MRQDKGKIGIKEYFALISLTIGAKLSDDTPAIIYENAKNAGWLATLLIGLLSLFPIIFLIKVYSAHRGKNLHEILLHLFGRFFGTFISVCLLIGGTTAVIADSGTYVDIIGSMYFTKTPAIILYIILMVICAYGAKRGIEQIGSVSWLLLPYIKITLFIALVFTFKKGTLGYLFPFWGEGPLEVAKASVKNVSIFVDFLYLGLIMPLISSYKDMKKGTLIGLGFLTVELSLALVAFVVLFDYTTAEMLNYPFHETIRFIQIGFLANVETFFFPFWLVATFIRFSFYLYLIATLLGGILKIKEFEYLIPLIATIILLIGLSPDAPPITLYTIREKILVLLSPAFMILPPLMWVVAKIRGDFKNENSFYNN
ncbi:MULTISPECIES: endospore germination permease [unclassified Bacillus (in: firmicutes)]|uniref:GerAB/ArcD/ProY family transporter n=1 Tax=unclassified Bacillus (in: firmicutes) TaxID=185979 RepID=UPI001BEC1D2F|nr:MULTISPECIES: endospore germination permease [unclassified Bacillus (in: firmicutes)]MBT2638155.1 endospore germination permease [Bacillus sp. ISL-39]MBT2659686.1 endospore germination permease [Bacillus sp. ISL-45]